MPIEITCRCVQSDGLASEEESVSGRRPGRQEGDLTRQEHSQILLRLHARFVTIAETTQGRTIFTTRIFPRYETTTAAMY